MQHIKYLLLTLTLISFIACNSTKEPKKVKEIEVPKENNTTTSPLGILSPKQKRVHQELNAYLQELSTFNTDAIVDLTYPKLFHVIDLDLYRQYIASMMNSTDIEMKSYESNITRLSAVTAFSNDTEFAQAQYISTINIHFLNNNLYGDEKKINFLYDALIHKYGKENITVNVRNRTLRIKKIEKLLIIKEKDTEWKFLGDNSKYRQLYPSFLPQEILKIIEKNKF
jgi:hypothetical protein